MWSSYCSLFTNCSNTFWPPKWVIIIVDSHPLLTASLVRLVLILPRYPFCSFAIPSFMNVDASNHFTFIGFTSSSTLSLPFSLVPATTLTYAHSSNCLKSGGTSFSLFLLSPFLHSYCSICIFLVPSTQSGKLFCILVISLLPNFETTPL